MLLAVGPSAANAKYSAIVVDANTGKTLFASSADSPRYPASLTKMMTLYMVFEALERGKITKTTRVPFSAHAAAKPPTKLGVKAGSSVTVETAILALVTKSANDAAAAVGELLGGSEAGFARMMTTRARQLGMKNTTFRNASGLPDTQQRSTARDMAILGMALKRDFPQYYSYFSTRSFTFGKTRMANHNRLLGRVKGVDGIKTGYTRASGFNLVSSVSDGNRRLVAVVMGGTSGRARDNHMAELIKQYLPKASTRKSSGGLFAQADSSEAPQTLADLILPGRKAPTPEARPEEETLLSLAAEQEAETAEGSAVEDVIEDAKAVAAVTPKAAVEVDTVKTASIAPGWSIQVASTPSEADARAFLAKTSSAVPGVLASASPYTVVFRKDGTTYHRARFGGFASKTAAWNACDALKKKRIDCYAVQQ